MVLLSTLLACAVNSEGPPGDQPVSDGCEIGSSIEVSAEETPSFGPSAVGLVATLDKESWVIHLESPESDVPLDDVLSVSFELGLGPVLEQDRTQLPYAAMCASGLVRVAPVDIAISGAELTADGTGEVVWRGEGDDDAFVSFRFDLGAPPAWMQELADDNPTCGANPASLAFKSLASGDSPWSDPVLSVIYTTDDCVGVLYRNRSGVFVME